MFTRTLTAYLGADLVLRQLGLRNYYLPGSVVLIRGHEPAHSTTEWTEESRSVVVQTTHEAVREQAYRNLGRPYPPLALASNFETGAFKRKASAAAKPGNNAAIRDDAEGSAINIAAQQAVPATQPPAAGNDDDKAESRIDLANTVPVTDEDAAATASPSAHSSDTDISCCDFSALEDYPDLDVEPDKRGYMDFAFIEDMEGPCITS